ncbi:hypothetical protein HMPREF9098_2455 [Kingella denitrificans ATCC 33394]|uniref:Uncharacterized protein n=1 Tax=Kingella denitrificans ATCC 33394 TaxID=888741 RepID=F0F2X0_9NEIS|nr:hypothetical protein HMPREF9098_2455 [Kingella denitrificans ATCC 33394]
MRHNPEFPALQEKICRKQPALLTQTAYNVAPRKQTAHHTTPLWVIY